MGIFVHNTKEKRKKNNSQTFFFLLLRVAGGCKIFCSHGTLQKKKKRKTFVTQSWESMI